MENKIIKPHEVHKYQKFLGNKTLHLKECLDQGFRVPPFIALSSKITAQILKEENFRKEIVSETLSFLKCKKYAIRSSALIEDGKTKSFAGQFLTKINLSDNDLEKGILEVLQHAEKYLNGNLEQFSLIIQEYIVPDIFGVTFTRNPNGNREIIIEYGFCEGERIVGGEIQPLKISLYWNEELIKTPKFLTKKIVDDFKQIEKNNDFPQDIEWCIRDGEFYILQTRNITTISQKQYEEIIFLEEFLSYEKKYFYEKTEISEIAPRPCPITYDLLSKIYSEKGPVSKVYEKYGISYKNTNFLKIIGNELYVDKEKEIQSILSSYTYFSSLQFKMKIKWTNILSTFKNIFFLNTIKTDTYEILFVKIKKLLESEKYIDTFQEALEGFLNEYETIFEINLLSGFSFKKLSFLLKRESILLVDVLAHKDFFVSGKDFTVKKLFNLKGNSIDIRDETDFIQENKNLAPENGHIQIWWASLSKQKKKLLEGKIREVIFYDYLREMGRHLTVKNINILRGKLLEYAKNEGFKDPDNAYFSSLSLLLDEEKESKIKQQYISFDAYQLPNRITSSFVTEVQGLTGVSGGQAAGELQNINFLKRKNIGSKKIILYTKSLSPHIAEHFGKISGIVSENGGILSHLAIIAREQHIPVVVGFSIGKNKINLGDIITIDGSYGKIEKQE